MTSVLLPRTFTNRSMSRFIRGDRMDDEERKEIIAALEVEDPFAVLWLRFLGQADTRRRQCGPSLHPDAQELSEEQRLLLWTFALDRFHSRGMARTIRRQLGGAKLMKRWISVSAPLNVEYRPAAAEVLGLVLGLIPPGVVREQLEAAITSCGFHRGVLRQLTQTV